MPQGFKPYSHSTVEAQKKPRETNDYCLVHVNVGKLWNCVTKSELSLVELPWTVSKYIFIYFNFFFATYGIRLLIWFRNNASWEESLGEVGGVIKLSKLDGDFLELKCYEKRLSWFRSWFGMNIFSALFRGLFVLGITLIICITEIHGSGGTLYFIVDGCFHRVYQGE